VEVEDDDSRTKASLVLRAETAELCLAASRRLIEQLGVLGDGFVVSPSGAPTTTRKNGCKMFVDVTPTAAGKGCSTAHLMSVFGATSERVLVAGDSENDVAMMRLCCGASPVAGVIVANASVELLRWHAANPGRRIVAVESGPLGVLEGFRHFAGVAPTVLQDELNTAAVSTLNYLDPAAAEVASVLRPICACEAGALTELRSREGANLTSVLQETCRQGLWLRGTACVQCIMDSDHEALRSQSMDVSACCTLALDATCSKPRAMLTPTSRMGLHVQQKWRSQACTCLRLIVSAMRANRPRSAAPENVMQRCVPWRGGTPFHASCGQAVARCGIWPARLQRCEMLRLSTLPSWLLRRSSLAVPLTKTTHRCSARLWARWHALQCMVASVAARASRALRRR